MGALSVGASCSTRSTCSRRVLGQGTAHRLRSVHCSSTTFMAGPASFRAAFNPAHDLLAGAVKTAHHGSLGNPQGTSGLLVGEAGDIDRDQNVSMLGRKGGDPCVDLVGL